MKKPTNVSLEDVRDDPTLRWRVLVGVLGVIAAASVLGNIALGAVLSSYVAIREQRDTAKETATAAKSKEAEAEAERLKAEEAVRLRETELADLNRRIAGLSSDLAKTRAAEQQAKRERDNAVGDPTTLPSLGERGVLRRIGAIKITASVSQAAMDLGLRESLVAEEARSAARRANRDVQESAKVTLLLRVSGSIRSNGAGVWIIQVSVLERWRVPGTDSSASITVYEDGKIIETSSSGYSNDLLAAVAEVTAKLCDAINDANK